MPSVDPRVAHARELHARAIVITSHDHLVEPDDLMAMRDGGLDAKVCMLQVDVLAWDEEGPGSALASIYSYDGWARRALTKLERVLRLVDAQPDRFLVVRRAGDIVRAHQTGRSGIIFGLEGCRPLEGEIDMLRRFHRLGLRHLQLTWSFGNQVCDRVTPPTGVLSWSNFRGTKLAGITPFGRQVVAEANRLGIVLDPSHATEQTYRDLFELSEQPIVIGHATCKDAGKNAGDVSDTWLRALARNGGVICMHVFSHYLRDRNATIDDLIDHILHVAAVAGIDHVGLGPDWLRIDEHFLRVHDLFKGPGFQRDPEQPLGPIADLAGIDTLPRVTERLVERGFADDHIRKILGENLLRVYRQVWGA